MFVFLHKVCYIFYFYFLFLSSFVFFSSVAFFSLKFNLNTLDIYSFDIFYVHVISSIFNLIFFWLILISTAIIIFKFFSFYLLLFRQVILALCLWSCSISILTGELWSIATWGTWAPFDSRFVSLILLFIMYLFIYLFVDRGLILGRKNFINLSNWFCILLSFLFPVVKYSVSWWNSIHMSSAITPVYENSVGVNYEFFTILFFFYFFYLLLFSFFFIQFFYIRFKMSFV